MERIDGDEKFESPLSQQQKRNMKPTSYIQTSPENTTLQLSPRQSPMFIPSALAAQRRRSSTTQGYLQSSLTPSSQADHSRLNKRRETSILSFYSINPSNKALLKENSSSPSSHIQLNQLFFRGNSQKGSRKQSIQTAFITPNLLSKRSSPSSKSVISSEAKSNKHVEHSQNQLNLNHPHQNRVFSAKNQEDHIRRCHKAYSFQQNRDKQVKNDQLNLDKSFIIAFNDSQFSPVDPSLSSSFYRSHKFIQKNFHCSSAMENNKQNRSISTEGDYTRNTNNKSSSSRYVSPQSNRHLATSPSARRKQSEATIKIESLSNSILQQKSGQRWEKFVSELENCRTIEDSMHIIDNCLKCVEENNFRSLMPYLVELLSRSVDINDLKLFQQTSFFMAELAFEMNDLNAASFLFDQCRIMFALTEQNAKKAKVLLELSKCARIISMNAESLILLKKGLEYAWLAKDKELELEIYDEMGRNYLYLGLISSANYYHNRFADGELEANHSISKEFSEEAISDFKKTIPYTFKDVSSLFLSYLKIPLFTLQQINQKDNEISSNSSSPRAKVRKESQTDFDMCTAQEVITKTLKEEEFQVSIQSPRFRILKEEEDDRRDFHNQVKPIKTETNLSMPNDNIRRVIVPSGLTSGKSSKIYDVNSLGIVDEESKMRDFSNPFKYKMSLDKKIQFLMKQKLDPQIDMKLARVRQARFEKRSELQLRDRVYVNSQSRPSQSSTKKLITNNYKKMFKTFIINYLEGKFIKPTKTKKEHSHKEIDRILELD